MNSTELARERSLSAFFREQLAAIAAARHGEPFFPLAPEATLTSYYRSRDPNDSYIFELDSNSVESQLMALWSDTPELQQLVRPLLKLAAEFGRSEETSGDVSPFVYAMF